MAQGQVAARMKGDNYQGRFFWYQAALLFFDNSHVERVAAEHDAASGVDDVAVFYKVPGVFDSGRYVQADYFQVKYHLDHRDQYSADALTDPSFVNAEISLLGRFHRAYRALRDVHPWFRLCLVSNWDWQRDDPLASSIRDCDGSLPDAFFTDGPRSKLGRTREAWQARLSIEEKEFPDFAQRLRLEFNYFGRNGLKEALSDRLYRAGLAPIDPTRECVPYDDLYNKFVMSGRQEFDLAGLREVCEREGLVRGQPTLRDPRRIGVRSFMRFAQNLEEECSSFICLASHFDGRCIRDDALWSSAVFPELQRFLEDPRLRSGEHHLLLECHLSVAFAAGYVLDRKSGTQVYPVQKGLETRVWKPGEEGASSADAQDWLVQREDGDPASRAVVVALNVTHKVDAEVRCHIWGWDRRPRLFLSVAPAGGIGAQAIRGADRAVTLVERLQQILRDVKAELGGGPMTLHVFAAAPNGLMFFLGQVARALGPIQLYEFDFGGGCGGGYTPSLRFPHV